MSGDKFPSRGYIMRKTVLLLISFLFAVPAAVHAADTGILVVPFYGESASDVTSFMKSLSDKAPSQTSFLDPAVKAPELPADGINSKELINELAKIGKSQNAEYVLTGLISRMDGFLTIHPMLVSVADSDIKYSTNIFVYKCDLNYNPAPDVWGRVQFALDGKFFLVNNLKVGDGDSANEIAVEWEAVPDCTEYLVYRGKKMDGAFELAGKTKKPALYDTKSEIGVKLFYYVQPVMSGIRCEPSFPVAGYRKPAIPKGEDLRKMLSTFNKPAPRLTSDESKKASGQINLIRPFYQNRTKLNLTLYLIQGYLSRKELFVYRNFPEPVVDTEKRLITLTSADGSYSVLFDNNSFFTKIVKLNDPELTNRLLKNAVYFCVHKGVKEITDENGDTRYINDFEAIGMCTQYFKESRDWQDTTIIFGTSNKELKAKMDEARRKMEGGPQNQY